METRDRTRGPWWGFLGIVLICAAWTGGGEVRAASSGICVTVEVGAPILLPTGEIAPPGELTLCDSLEYSPVASLHKAFVNGQPVGMLRSWKRSSEGPIGPSPRVIFRGDGRGNLVLVGYVLPDANRTLAFILNGDTGRIASATTILARR